jgi:hypothetical protein
MTTGVEHRAALHSIGEFVLMSIPDNSDVCAKLPSGRRVVKQMYASQPTNQGLDEQIVLLCAGSKAKQPILEQARRALQSVAVVCGELTLTRQQATDPTGGSEIAIDSRPERSRGDQLS